MAAKTCYGAAMSGARRVILVDQDSRRRAAISHCLSGSDIHVEPFEDIAEFNGRWPQSGQFLVHDEGDILTQLIARMVGSGTWLPVIAFAEVAETPKVVTAILNGAIDYVTWPFDGPAFAAALETAQVRARAAGNARLREAVSRSRIERLTPREREVLRGVASGHPNRLIAEHLDISPRTVEIHRANMLNKIGASHTSEAIRIAIEASLVG